MAIDAWGNWDGKPDYGTPTLQGSGTAVTAPAIQGSSPTLQASNTGTGDQRFTSPSGGGYVLGATTAYEEPSAPAYDPVAAAAAAKAAEDARRAGILRGEITNLVNSVKDIFNQRYGQVDAAVADQGNRLNDRFGKESTDINNQVTNENQKLGVAHAAGGSFDSSYRGNNVDTVSNAGKSQIAGLGTELQENMAKVGGWGAQKKTGFDAEKGAMDTLVSRIAESTDPAELTSIRNSLDSKIAGLRGEAADNNTTSQNIQALNAIVPTNSRAQQLKTTLSQIVAGNADATQKATIGEALIANAQLSPQEEQQLRIALQSDLATTEKPQA